MPAGPVHTVGEALSHPQTLARGMVVELDHPQAGPAPLLGQHTRELLHEHGYSHGEIDELVAQGVVEDSMRA